MDLTRFQIKKIAIIVGFIIIVIVLIWLIYIVFFKPLTPTPPIGITPTTTPPGIGGLPGTEPGVGRPTVEPVKPGELPSAIARGGLTETTKLVTNPVKSLSPASGNQVAYYDEIKGKFFSLDPDGNIIALSEKKFANVETVSWAPASNKAILEFPDGANIFYEFSTDRQVTLPKHWTDFHFSPDGDKILFKSIAMEPENNFLFISDETGSGAQIVTFLGENHDIVLPDWSPNRQIVASYAEPLDAGRSTVNFLGLNNENFKQLVVNGYNFDARWNPNGTQLLYQVSSSATNDNHSLWIVNAQGNAIGTGRRPLNIQTTVDKCIFADTATVYCAVPQFLPQGSGIIPALARGIPDDIYKINVSTGSSAKLAELDIPMPIGSLMLSPDQRYLYFTDGLTGSLRKIRLK